MALILVLCLTVTGGCQQADPLAKAFNAMGGRAALLELRGFSYESEGDRFEPGQGLNPTADPIKASSFTLALLYDVDNDALSLDWQRQILDPLRGEIAYRDILNGDVGYQTGNDSVFNPPGVTSEPGPHLRAYRGRTEGVSAPQPTALSTCSRREQGRGDRQGRR